MSKTVKVTYRWYRNGKAITKATHLTYKLTSKDKGKKVFVHIHVADHGYQSSSVNSRPRKVH